MATTMNSTRAFSGRKVHKWRDYLESEVGWPVDFSGYDEETFEAQIEFARYGSISLRSNWISPVIANRRPAHVAPMKEQAFLLSLHLTGELESLGISHRYICKLFALEADSAMRYIQRRRLEKCASQLSSPMWRGHTISEIAFSWGFNSSAHFTRSFRAHFGCTPRQYRAQATAPPRLKNATAKFM